MKFLRKLTCFALALSVFLGAYSLLGARAVGAYAGNEGTTEHPEAKLEIALNVGQNIAVKAIAALPKWASGVKATFNWNSGETEYSQTIEASSEDCFIDGNTYTFIYRGITPEYMANVVNITVEYNDGKTLTGSQSVKGYLETLLSVKPASVSDYAYGYLKTLAYDLLDYGAAAQSYKGETVAANLVNGGVEKGDSFFESDITDKYEATTVNVKWGAGARYDYSVKPVVKFSLKDTSMVTEGSQVYAKVKFGEAEEYEVEVEKLGDNGYIAVLNDFDLLKADEVFTVTAYLDGTLLDAFTNSFASLAKKVSYNKRTTSEAAQTPTADVKLVAATYVYAKSALAYDKVQNPGEQTYTFEAENAIINDSKNGYTIAKDGINGEKYIANFNQADDNAYILFNVTAVEDCTVKLVISTTRRTDGNKLFNAVYKLAVNGVDVPVDDTLGVGKYTGEAGKNWITFYDTEITEINLKKGNNQIKFIKAGTGLNFDAIRLVSDTVLYADTYTFEAEEAEASETLKTELAGTASSGEYLAGLYGKSATITFTVYSDNECYSALYLRTNGHYATTYPLANYYKVNVNGTPYSADSGAQLVANMVCKDDVWAAFHDTKVCDVKLQKGVNKIVFSNIGASINFDAIKIVSMAKLDLETYSEMKIEAEDCTLGGTATAKTEDGMNNPSGGKFVGGLSGNVGSVTFTVYAAEDCTAQFVLCYGNRTNDTSDRKFATKFTLTVNGEEQTSETVFNNGTENNYFGWEEYTICTVNLVAGKNTFVLTSKGVTASNIDYFRIVAESNVLFTLA